MMVKMEANDDEMMVLWRWNDGENDGENGDEMMVKIEANDK
jgi:hypothetical protein